MPSQDAEMADAEAAAPATEAVEEREKVGSKEHKHKHKSRDKDRDRERHKSHKSSSRRDKDKDKEKDKTERSRQRSSERGRVEAPHDGEAPDAAQQREDSPLQGDVPVPSVPPAAAEPGPAEPPAAEQNGAAAAGAAPFQQSTEGAEVSMSIEETNKMRVAMGLKPLKVEGGTTEEREAKERAAGKAREEERRRKTEAAELRERIETAKAKRKMEADLAKVKGLGEAKPEVDDVAAWVSRSRESEAEAKRKAEREKAAKVASMYDEEDDESDEDREQPAAAELDGLKVAHDAEGLDAGETVILTLKDRSILEEGDDDPEELEDVLATEHRKRERARKAAVKPAVEYDEDGHVKGMLSKYDVEEEGAGFRIRAGAVVADERGRQAAEERRKLAESTETLAAGGPATFQNAADFYSKEEAAAFAKPKKRLRKKLRKKAGGDDEKAVPSETVAAVAALEEAAAAQAAAGGAAASDHGSRGSRGAANSAGKAAEEAADAKRRRDRYDAALAKANYATLAASTAPIRTPAGGAGEEEDDDVRAALEASMRRSRAGASTRRDADAVAAEVVKRRQDEEAQPAADAAGGERLTEATEFARLVGQRDGGGGGGDDADAGEHMDVDAPRAAALAVGAKRKYRAAVKASSDDEAGPSSAPAESRLPPPPAGGPPPIKEEDSVTRERHIGKGVAGVLGLLKDRGELNGAGSLRAVEWAGRTNDMKPVALQGLEAVYTGGRSASELENSVERALTRRDTMGRVLTPKEAFRDLCHHFHGIFPSKSNQERQMEKDAETAAAKRAATSENPASLRRLQAAQKQAAAPYVVLSGSVRPGQTSDPTSGFATATGYQSAAGAASVAPTPSLTPMLGGGRTPLVGDAKVKAMLGMKREGGASMPPPPSRQRRG